MSRLLIIFAAFIFEVLYTIASMFYLLKSKLRTIIPGTQKSGRLAQ